MNSSHATDAPAPHDVDALIGLFNAGRFAEAENAALRLAATYPAHALLHNIVGAARAAQGNLDGAIAAYRQAIEAAPDVADAHSNLGLALQAKGSHVDALACFDHALALRPNFADALNNQGMTLQALGRLEEAIQSFGRAAAANPADAEIHFNLGNALADAGRFDEAVASFQNAVQMQPGLAVAHHNMGNALKNAGRYAAAIEAFERVLTLRPRDAAAWNGLGTVYRKIYKPLDAVAAFERATEAQPNATEPMVNLGAVLQELGRLDEAEAMCVKAIALAPKSAAAHNNLGAVLRERGRHAEAAEHYRQATELDPAFLDAHRNLISLQFSELDTDIATAHSEELFWANPKKLAPLAGVIVESLINMQKLGAAKAFVGKLAAAGLHATDIARHETACLSAAGDYAAAVRTAERAKGAVAPIELARLRLLGGDAGGALDDLGRTASVTQEDKIKSAAIRWHAVKRAGAGDNALFDVDRFVYRAHLDDFAGMDDVPGFLADLKVELEGLHLSRDAPLDQSLRGGTQTVGHLFAKHGDKPTIARLGQAMLQGLAKHFEINEIRAKNQILAALASKPRFTGSWSVKLRDAGYHVDHIHPEGLVSGVFYVSLPDCVGPDDPARQGWLKFGQPTPNPFGLEPDGWACPGEGVMVLFPSYFWHGTVPFHGPGHRLTVAFDIA